MALVADRRWGVGCDLIAVLEESDKADIRVYFFNADGSESGACGNASRCIADILINESKKETCTIEVNDGILNCRKKDDLFIEVDMGVPKDIRDLDLKRGEVSNPVALDMGNPHCIFFVDDLEDIPVDELGAYFEVHKEFPEKANVGFAQVQDKGHIRLRTWERGVGLTEACGTNACATVVSAVRRDLTDRKVEIEVDGGALTLEWREEDHHVLMTGPVAYVFDGALNTV